MSKGTAPAGAAFGSVGGVNTVASGAVPAVVASPAVVAVTDVLDVEAPAGPFAFLSLEPLPQAAAVRVIAINRSASARLIPLPPWWSSGPTASGSTSWAPSSTAAATRRRPTPHGR